MVMRIVWFVIEWGLMDILAWCLWSIGLYFHSIYSFGRYGAAWFTEKYAAEVIDQRRWLEWVRFVIWPYGIAQRTMAYIRCMRTWKEQQ